MLEIEAPDGSIVEFPDGTPDDVIVRVMRQNFGGPDASAGPPPAKDALDDAVSQFGQGFNRGLDSIINLPYNALDAGANLMGGDLPDAQPIVARLNSGQAPSTTAGRIAGVAGETFGSSAIPSAGIYARALTPALQNAPRVAAAIPETLPRAIGKQVLDSIRAAPAQSAALEAASTAGSGVAAGTAREFGAGPTVETLAALAGGLAPAAIPQLNPKLPPRPQIVPDAGDFDAPQAGATSAAGRTAQKTEASAASKSLQTTIDENLRAMGAGEPDPNAQIMPAKTAKIVTPAGEMEIDAVPDVVELSSLKLAEGDFQPRNRVREEYITEARGRARDLDAARLGVSRTSDTGAPIILEDGTIISGNGRTLSISAAYRDPGLDAQAGQYRASIPAELQAKARGMKEPVFVMRSKLASDDAKRFARLSNPQMNRAERATADVAALNADDMALYRGGDFDSPENIAFMQRFVAKAVKPAEMPDFSADGRLTMAGSERMRAAILASTFDDPRMVERLLERSDEAVKGVTAAAVDAAPALSSLKANIKRGNVKADLDPTADIAAALRHLSDLRRRGVSVKSYFDQADMLQRPISEEAEVWLQSFYDPELKTQLPRAQIASLIRTYADEAGKHAQNQLFGDPTTKTEVLEAAWKRVGRETPPAEMVSPSPAASAQSDIPGSVSPARLTGPDGQQVEPLFGADGKTRVGYVDANGQQFTRTQIEGKRASTADTLQKLVDGGQPPQGPELRPDFSRAPKYVPEKIMPLVEEREPATVFNPTREELVGAAERQEIQLPRGSVSEKLRGVTGRLKDIPVIGQPIVKAAERTMQQLADAKTALVDGLGKSGRFVVGDAVATGLREWIHDGSQQLQKRLYGEVHKLIKSDVKQQLIATRGLITELRKEMDNAASERFQSVIGLLDDGAKRREGLNYQGLLDLRSEIGARLSTAKLTGDIAEEGWKRAYGALSEDLARVVYEGGEAVRKGNGKRAVAAWHKANNAARRIQDERDELAKLVGVRKNEPRPNEAVVDAVLNLAKRGAGGNYQTLFKVKRRLSEEVWQSVAAEALARMGVGRDGKFSPARFIADYNDLSNNAKHLFFGDRATKESIDDLVTIAALQKELSRLGNPSGTAGASFIISLIFGGPSALAYYGGASGLASAAIGAGSGYAVATWLARPATLKAAGPLAKSWQSLQESGSRTAQMRFSLAVKTFAGALADEAGGDEKELAREIEAAMSGGRNAVAN